MKLDSAHRLGDVLADTSVINQLTDEEKKQVKAEWFNGQPEINN